MQKINLSEVSVVICNKNSLNFLKKSIPVYKKNNLNEIIVIDGNSEDGSLKYLEELNIKVISDEGKGLSQSRKLGIINSKGKYIFMAGPDDICDELFFTKLLNKFLSSDYDAVTVGLKIFKPVTYWDNSLNAWYSYIRKKKKKVDVIGTPTLFKKKVYKFVNYNINTVGCDDTDISEQLLNNNYNIGIIDVFCDQANRNNFKDISVKFQLYGQSDINFYYFKNSKTNFKHLFITLTHSFRHFLKFSYYILSKKNLSNFLFIIIATYYRYLGLLKNLNFKKFNNLVN